MKMHARWFSVIVILFLTACSGGGGSSNNCEDDKVNSVDTGNGCIQLLTSTSLSKPRILWVFIHGDGNSDYLFNFLSSLADNDSVAVGVIRPGYVTADGRLSTGPDSDRDFDHYTQAVTDTLAAGISKLKTHYDPDELIVVGHSGGAALTSLIASFYPDLIDREVLVSCPCNIPEWRRLRAGNNEPWIRSLSPHDHVNGLNTQVPLVAIVGAEDTNTYPQLSIDYAALAQTAGVMATHEVIAGADHDGVILDSQPLTDVISQWITN